MAEGKEEQRMNSPGEHEVEVWKLIEGCADYEVSSFGRVRSRKVKGSPWLKGPWKILSLKGASAAENGYAHVSLAQGKTKQKSYTKVYVHILVALAFHGPKPTASHVVNHDDLDKKNNYHGNLEWVTKSDNFKHAFRAGRTLGHTDSKGEKNVHAQLTDDKVLKIRKIWAHNLKYPKRVRKHANMTQKDLAKRFNVSEHLIQRVCNRETWKHI